MIRSVRFSIENITKLKMEKITEILIRYQAAVNSYIDEIWNNNGKFNKITLDVVKVNSNLPSNFLCSALNQAIGICNARKASAKALHIKLVKPIFKGGMKLNVRTASTYLNNPSEHFDIWFKLSTFKSRKRINIPAKRHKVFNKWLNFPGSKLLPGFQIGSINNKLHIIVWFEIQDGHLKKEGKSIGVDVGINKILTTSEGTKIGEEFKLLCEKVKRKKPGSRNRKGAANARDRYLGWCINQLHWNEIKFIGVENLKNLKIGKKSNRNKSFRKFVAPWRYAYVLRRIEEKAMENCVRHVQVSPSYTSQICPECSHRAISNRANEIFKCCSCGYAADADLVGSLNILARSLGSISSPKLISEKSEEALI